MYIKKIALNSLESYICKNMSVEYADEICHPKRNMGYLTRVSEMLNNKCLVGWKVGWLAGWLVRPLCPPQGLDSLNQDWHSTISFNR